MEIVEMNMGDFDGYIDLVRRSEGVTLRAADSAVAVERYLLRNPGMSFVAREAGRVIGGVLGGHDGRRGYLHHLVVDTAFRGRGIGRALINECLERLQRDGIDKVHVDVLAGNEGAQQFWTHLGWSRRNDLVRFSVLSSEDQDT